MKSTGYSSFPLRGKAGMGAAQGLMRREISVSAAAMLHQEEI